VTSWLARARAARSIPEREPDPVTIGTKETIDRETGPERPIVPTVPFVTASDVEERAAIVEEGAKVPRKWVEGFAELEARPIPRGVDRATWLAMMDAAGRFLDQWGSAAAALGWTAGELFGPDPTAPLNRRDRRGAAFFLANAEVIAITAEAITLRVGGSVQSLRRRDGFALPAWEDEP
jgi:hypothetical protein